MLFGNDMNEVLDVFIEKYGYAVSSDGFVPDNARARKVYLRLIRRARKARKNLVMYKTAGRRPWTGNNGVLYSSKAGVERMAQNGDDALSIAARYRSGPKLHRHDVRYHLRERSGFLDMSRLAEGMKRHPYDEFEEWLQESWGDLTPDEIAERIGRQP